MLEGEDPYLLFHATDATRLSDGRIVLVNRGTAELRVFDEFGTYLATWGGKGEGPGEFEDIMQIAALPGDSVIAWGLSADAAMHVFDAAGNFGRRFSPLKSESSLRTQWTLPVSVMRDGSILASQQPDRVDSVAVDLWDGEGRLQSSLGSHPAQVVQIIGNLLHHETFGRTLASGWRNTSRRRTTGPPASGPSSTPRGGCWAMWRRRRSWRSTRSAKTTSWATLGMNWTSSMCRCGRWTARGS